MFKKKKKNIVEQVTDKTEKLEPEIKEMVIGKNTIFSLLSFGIGTVLLGNFFWQVSSNYFGSILTAVFGLVLFVVGGVISHEFRK